VTYLTYAFVAPVVEHQLPMSCCLHCAPCEMCLLQLLLHSSSPHVLGPAFSPLSLWVPLFVILLQSLLNICPIHVHLLLFSKISADSCFVAFCKSLFLILYDRLIANQSKTVSQFGTVQAFVKDIPV